MKYNSCKLKLRNNIQNKYLIIINPYIFGKEIHKKK
jgi:hypothetical protein